MIPILNELEYIVRQKHYWETRQTLYEVEHITPPENQIFLPNIRALYLDGLKTRLAELKAEIEEYEQHTGGAA